MTTPTDLAQALRELIAHTKGCEVLLDIPEQPTTTAAREALAAHESRAQPAITHADEEAGVAQWKEWMEEGRHAYLAQESAPGHLPHMQESINFAIAYALRKLRVPAQPASVQRILADMRRTASADASGIDAAILGWADGIEAAIPAQPASVADVPWVAISNAVRAYERTAGEYPKAKDRTTLRKQCRAIHEWLAAAPQPQAKDRPVCNRDCDCVGECKAGVE